MLPHRRDLLPDSDPQHLLLAAAPFSELVGEQVRGGLCSWLASRPLPLLMEPLVPGQKGR